MSPEEAKISYNELINEARCMKLEKTKEVYTEVHHILPRSLGGTDNSDNLVRMLGRKHFETHWLQVMMWDVGSLQWIKMISALCKMSFGLHKEIMAEEYEKMRSLLSQATSIRLRGKMGGKNNPGARSVLQYTYDGRLVEQYDATSIAEIATGISKSNICNCCQGKRLQAGGFIWKYATELPNKVCKKRTEQQKQIYSIAQCAISEQKSKSQHGRKKSELEISNIRKTQQREDVRAANSSRNMGAGNGNAKTVNCYTKDFVFIEQYEATLVAQRVCSVSHIADVCRGERPFAGGFIWRYASDCDPITHMPLEKNS